MAHPVHLVPDPGDHPERWSSCPAKVGRIKQPWLDFDPLYLRMGRSKAKRAKQYAAWLREAVPESEWQRIRQATQRGQLTATERFAEELSEKFGRRLELRGPGRPRKGSK